jgi:RES domain-containing protein
MTTLWRISNYAELSGEGGMRASARWHTKGRLIVYLAESPASALLERIVHLTDRNEDGDLPPYYQLLKISVPDECEIKSLTTLVPIDWREQDDFTRSMGDSWLASLETPLARVPSSIVPHTANFLLNPEHTLATRVLIEERTKERFDNRLFRFGPR